MKIKGLLILIFAAFTCSTTYGQHLNNKKFSHENGTYVDERDGKVYQTIT